MGDRKVPLPFGVLSGRIVPFPTGGVPGSGAVSARIRRDYLVLGKKAPALCNKAGRPRPRAHARVRVPMPFGERADGRYHWSCNTHNYIAKEHRMNPELSELARLRTMSTVYSMIGMDVPEMERLVELEAKYEVKEKV